MKQTQTTKTSRAEAGRKGGQTTAARYGKDHMSHIGYMGMLSTAERHYSGDVDTMMDELRARAEKPVWDDALKCWKRPAARQN